jgi:hypothetical protein
VLAVVPVEVPVKRTAHLSVERLCSPITVGLFKYGETREDVKLEATDPKRVPVVEVLVVQERTRATILKGVPAELE